MRLDEGDEPARGKDEGQLAVERWAQSDPVLEAWVRANPNVPLVRAIKGTLRSLNGPCSGRAEMSKRLENLGADAKRAAGAGLITDEEDLVDARLGEFTPDLDRMARTIRHLWGEVARLEKEKERPMSDEQLPTDEHPGMDPTNARLAVLIADQTRKILQSLARLEKLIAGPSPSEPALRFEEMREVMERALREDREYLPEHSRHLFPCGTREGETLHTLIRLFAHVIDRELYHRADEVRRPRGAAPFESADPEADLEAEEPAGPVVDYIPVSWEEYGERIKTMLAKSVKKEREMTEAIDAVMAAGLMAVSEKGNVALALGELIATMIPEGGPMREIPEGWAPVVLAINPMTGDFLTIAGPRSEPDGRVEPVETMVGRLMSNAVAEAVGAVREAGRPQPKPCDGAALGLEGSCPICRLGEVVKLGDDFECAKCGRLFCGKCGGVKGAPHENVAACSCEGRTL